MGEVLIGLCPFLKRSGEFSEERLVGYIEG
jgi:hypothetical protein